MTSMPTPALSSSTDAAASFVSVPLRPRFFQASAFFPLPVVLLSTRGPEGEPNLAPYSLCFPVLSEELHRLTLVVTTASKTAANLERTGRVSLNFLEDRPECFELCRALSAKVPTAEKMAKNPFELLDSSLEPGLDGTAAPPLVADAEQVFECRLVSVVRAGEGEERHFLLEVERVALKPRWAEVLERGGRGPRLAVGYGFRHAGGTWLSRPAVNVSGPRLRPRFDIEVEQSADAVEAAFRAALARSGCPVAGKVRRRLFQLNPLPGEVTTWSPSLELRIEANERGGCIVRGRIGPQPHVWTTFAGVHMLLVMLGVAGLMGGISLGLVHGTYWPMWIPVGTLFLNAFVAGAAFIGQGLGAEQTYRLRSFVDDVLEG
jgi:flavin reductase (DIM6/NTAB) family NADH-FMN oxidoreductase RutF